MRLVGLAYLSSALAVNLLVLLESLRQDQISTQTRNGGCVQRRCLMVINPVLCRSVTEEQLCLSTALAVNLLVLFRICAAVALLRRVLLSRAAPFSVLRLLRCFVLFHFCSSGA